MGQKAHEVTAEKIMRVAAWSKAGLTHDRIAAGIGCSDETLRKYYGPQLTAGADEWKADFEASILRDVRSIDCPVALRIFTAKVKLGWRELTPLDPDSKKPSEMNDDELRDAIAARERQRRSGPGAASKGERAHVAA